MTPAPVPPAWTVRCLSAAVLIAALSLPAAAQESPPAPEAPPPIEAPSGGAPVPVSDHGGKNLVVLGLPIPRAEPWVAATASALLTGAGQAYNEEWWKSGLFFASNLLYVGGYVGDLLTGQSVFRWSALGLVLAFKGWAVWDAYATTAARGPAPASPAALPAAAWLITLPVDGGGVGGGDRGGP